VEVTSNAQVIDVQEAMVLSGFINAHVHGSYNRSTLEAWVQGGVTTVRDLGNGDHRDRLFTLRDTWRDESQGARLIAVGPRVTVPGGYPIAPGGGSGLTVASPRDARQKVKELLDEGVASLSFFDSQQDQERGDRRLV
jgi:hypothetical protein